MWDVPLGDCHAAVAARNDNNFLSRHCEARSNLLGIATPLSRLAMPVKANCQYLVFRKRNIWIKLDLLRYHMVSDA